MDIVDKVTQVELSYMVELRVVQQLNNSLSAAWELF